MKVALINVFIVLAYKIIVQPVSLKELILHFVIVRMDNLMMVIILHVKVKYIYKNFKKIVLINVRFV